MLGVARRTLANHRRGGIRRAALADRLRAVTHTATTAPSEAAGERADALLASLSPDDRELVTLIHWEDPAIREAASVVGISAAAARKRLERIRSRATALAQL
ncbi:RNA polymerase sigma factor [Nocardioides sp. B-3]|uniref:RNA polymerase sigma factor n=1 Tax=Nocardioides sp. B-3 TaxID=2895565 RepID=UPI003FA5559E